MNKIYIILLDRWHMAHVYVLHKQSQRLSTSASQTLECDANDGN